MWLNYLKITIRNLQRHKGYTLINVSGLAIGLACCILIVLFVRHEYSYDRFHSKKDRIFRLEFDVRGTAGSSRWSVAPVPATPILRDQFPDAELVARIGYEDEPLIEVGEKQFFEKYYYKAEPTFFDIFDFEVVLGDAGELARPNTMILSESAAHKYFGDESPLGRTVRKVAKWSQEAAEYEVVGVMADPPSNSHVHPHFVASLATDLAKDTDNWRRISYTYVLLREGVDPEQLASRLKPITDQMDVVTNATATARLMPLLDIHLRGVGRTDIEPQGDIRYVWIFSAIALLILLIACMNYMNLASARAVRRAREVGIRKVVGARRSQLITQFIGEAVLQTALALVLAVTIAGLLLPAFNKLMEQPLELHTASIWFVVALVATALTVGLVSGSYPAFVLSRYLPTTVLKGAAAGHSQSRFRKALVVAQFTISAGLIAGTIVINRQLDFVQTTRLGFNGDQVLIVSARNALGTNAEAFKQALLDLPEVSGAALASGVPASGYAISFLDPEQIEEYAGSSDQSIVFDHIMADYDYVETLGLELKAGRNLSPDFPSDREDAWLINETAAKAMGWTDSPVGKVIERGDGNRVIVGVVGDFHVRSMREEIRPMLIELRGDAIYHVAVKLTATDVASGLASVRSTWERFVPSQPFEYSFLDDDFAAMYRSEARVGRLFSAFASLGIIIACLGLLGLAAYTAEQRTKEVGIRKVLGASVPAIVLLLSRDLIKLVLLSIVLVSPLVYILANKWLAGFAYRIELSWRIFALASSIAVAIAVATVCYQAIRAATADPVKSLRYE